MQSLNLKFGKHINELEALYIALDKLVDEKLKDNPKAGLIIAKGQPSETRVRYAEIKTQLRALMNSYALKGCFSFGICKDCEKFNNRASSIGENGRCIISNKPVHQYDTCEHHSKETGGFGL